jgi:hypothetical protein
MKGAHVLATYRRRYGIHDEANPGAQPRGAAERAERARAQRRIEAAQRRLGRGGKMRIVRHRFVSRHRAIRSQFPTSTSDRYVGTISTVGFLAEILL